MQKDKGKQFRLISRYGGYFENIQVKEPTYLQQAAIKAKRKGLRKGTQTDKEQKHRIRAWST